MSKASPKDFTIGCDPERFIVNEKGEPVSAAGIIPGTKTEPHPLIGGSCHPDGMAAEFGIEPCTSFAQFTDRVQGVMQQMEKFLPSGYKFHDVPYVRFSPEEFGKAPDDAKELGCNPDFDAWSGEMNPVPDPMLDPFLRTASGHVHIGFPGGPYELDDQHITTCRDFVKQLDWFVGSWTTFIDKDATRRQLYGKAGAFRPKPYGVEYRTPSNAWILNVNRMKNLWDRVQVAIGAMRNSYMPEQVDTATNEALVNQINQSKIRREFAEMYRYPLVTVF